MKTLFAVVALLCSLQAFADNAAFPEGPNPELTPGALCDHPTEHRYPERIAYCKRDVEKNEKNTVIRMYDEQLGYRIRQMDRQQFKIDHYIPLCAGGSNDMSNLWPQHRTVYEITDIMEQRACEKMAQGVLTQDKAIELIKKGKNDLSQVEDIVHYIEGL